MDATDEPTLSPEPIYQQMVEDADDATRSALRPAETPEPAVDRSVSESR
jgi:hypothetical protein